MGDLGMIKKGDEFKIIDNIMSRFGGKVNPAYPQNRGYTAGGHMVHVLIIGNKHMAGKGVTNSHGPGISWDEMYMESINGTLNPTQDPKKQALFVKDISQKPQEKMYTFRGIYEMDTTNSTGRKSVSRRVATDIDETLPEWKIVKLT
ncbi:hypothetical protein FACS189493_2170 [Spirochaetia bacterium]|nr:hypothetical protein FACS189493_2170 [Spirochaetia bacterium]